MYLVELTRFVRIAEYFVVEPLHNSKEGSISAQMDVVLNPGQKRRDSRIEGTTDWVIVLGFFIPIFRVPNKTEVHSSA